jgi:hypothetical protein
MNKSLTTLFFNIHIPKKKIPSKIDYDMNITK